MDEMTGARARTTAAALALGAGALALAGCSGTTAQAAGGLAQARQSAPGGLLYEQTSTAHAKNSQDPGAADLTVHVTLGSLGPTSVQGGSSAGQQAVRVGTSGLTIVLTNHASTPVTLTDQIMVAGLYAVGSPLCPDHPDLMLSTPVQGGFCRMPFAYTPQPLDPIPAGGTLTLDAGTLVFPVATDKQSTGTGGAFILDGLSPNDVAQDSKLLTAPDFIVTAAGHSLRDYFDCGDIVASNATSTLACSR